MLIASIAHRHIRLYSEIIFFAANIHLVFIKYNSIYSKTSESMSQISVNNDIKTVVSKYSVVIFVGFNSEIDSLVTNIIMDRKQVDNNNNNQTSSA